MEPPRSTTSLHVNAQVAMQQPSFDIFAALPAELLLTVFDFVPSAIDVLVLRCVSKTWKARIDSLKLHKRVGYFPKDVRVDWPSQGPQYIQPLDLLRNLRYLNISAFRLRNMWTEEWTLREGCPLLNTLVIQHMWAAPWDLPDLVAGSRIEVLRLTWISIKHCEGWLPQLYLCPSLRALELVLMHSFLEPMTEQPCRPASNHDVRRLPLLEKLRIEYYETTNDFQIANEADWKTIPREDIDYVAQDRLDAQGESLLVLLHLAPHLHTLEVLFPRDVYSSASNYMLGTFFDNMYDDRPGWNPGKDFSLKNVVLQGIDCIPWWLTRFQHVEACDINIEDRWDVIDERVLQSLSINFTMICKQRLPSFTHLPRTLRDLKLCDPGGRLTHTLFQTLAKKGPDSTYIYVENLSLCRETSAQYQTRVASEDIKPDLFNQFPAATEEDIERIVTWIPNLISIELIEVCDVPKATVQAILEQGLPNLKHLKIEWT